MIELLKISKKFGEKQVLNNLTFKINKGEFSAIIGRIGSGKTTTINIISGLIKPDSGTILINGREESYKNRNYVSDFGLLLSFDYLIDDFSSLLFWRCVGKLMGISRDELNKRIEEVINLCQVSDINKPIGTLSSGNKMLVKLGALFLKNPKVFLIDEPFLHLDILEIERVEKILKHFHNEGKTIVVASHFPESIYKISSSNIILDEGKVKDIITTKDFVSYDLYLSSLKEYFTNV